MTTRAKIAACHCMRVKAMWRRSAWLVQCVTRISSSRAREKSRKAKFSLWRVIFEKHKNKAKGSLILAVSRYKERFVQKIKSSSLCFFRDQPQLSLFTLPSPSQIPFHKGAVSEKSNTNNVIGVTVVQCVLNLRQSLCYSLSYYGWSFAETFENYYSSNRSKRLEHASFGMWVSNAFPSFSMFRKGSFPNELVIILLQWNLKLIYTLKAHSSS